MKTKTRKIAFITMFSAVNYVVFTFGKIDIPLAAGSSVAIHLANAVVVVSSLLLGPVEGGIAGAIGLSVADLLDPRYVMSAPKTFFLKFIIGYVSGTVFRKQNDDGKKSVFISAIAGLGCNVILDPVVGYLYKTYLLKIPQEAAKIILAWTSGVTLLNAVCCTGVSVLLYSALKKPFAQIYKR